MTASSLFAAVTVGLVLGVLAWWLVPGCRRVPCWLPPAVGVGAAVLGTVIARLAGVDTSRVSPVELVLQVALAAVSLGVVAATADRQSSTDRYDGAGKP